MSTPVLSIVIVSWNATELLAACLHSLRRAKHRFSREILIVDNASHISLPRMIRSDFPEMRLTVNSENRGFAAACNQGIAISCGSYVLLLNPDTEIIDPEAIDQLVEYMELHADTAAVGPRLVFADGRHQVGDAGYAPSPAAIAAWSLFLSRLFPRYCRGLYINARVVVTGPAAVEVDWLCGAALLVRREAVNQVGGMDETIFLYAEDIEWGCRMRAAQLKLVYLPTIRILHVGGGSEKLAHSGLVSTRWLESLAQVYQRFNHGRFYLTFRLLMTLGFLLRGLAYAGIAAHGPDHIQASKAKAMFAYARCCWRLKPSPTGLLPALPREHKL